MSYLSLSNHHPQVDDIDIAEMMVNLRSDHIPQTRCPTFNPFLPKSAPSSSFGLDNHSFHGEEKISYPRSDPWIRDSLTLFEDGRDDSNAWTKKASALRQPVSETVLSSFLSLIASRRKYFFLSHKHNL